MRCDIAHAREIEFEIRLKESRTAPGKQVYCEMIFQNEPDIPAPEAPFIEDLNITYARSGKDSMFKAGREIPLLMHIYRVVGLKPGSFKIGPIVFNYKSDTYRSNAVFLEVERNILPPSDKTTLPKEPPDDISKHIYITLDASKTTAYVNERVPIALNLHSDCLNISPVSVGKIKGDNLIIDDFSGAESTIVKQNDVTYRLVRYPTALVAPMAGQFTVIPDTVKVDLVGNNKNDMLVLLNRNAEFYEQFIGRSGKRSLELTASPVNITVLPLPQAGRPDDFTGAIGDFSFDLSISATEVKLDKEIILTMTIKGVGNYSTVSPPQMKKAAGIKWYAPRVIKGDNSVTFEQAIRIKSPDVREIPEAAFSFFSPGDKKYISIIKSPIPVRILGADMGVAMPAEKAREPEMKKEWVDSLKDVIYPLEERSVPFYRGGAFFMFETLPLLIALAGVILYAIVRYLKMHPLYTASFVASRKARKEIMRAGSMLGQKSPQEFYSLIFRILQGYLGTRRLKPTEGITSNIIDEIDMAGIEQDVIDKVRKIFYECYVVKYTKEALGKDEMRNTLDTLKYVVDNLDKKAEL